MRKKRLALLLFGLIVLVVFVGGCRRARKDSGPEEQRLHVGASGDLSVLSATPQGTATSRRDIETVVVMFDRPMASLDALPEGEGQPVLEFTPPFSGKTRWLGSRILAFTPERRFPSATKVEALVPAGTTALDGSTLKTDYAWTFQTPAPRLIRHYPQDKQKWLRLDTRVLLVFNQDMDRKSAGDFLSLVSIDQQGKEKRLTCRISHPSAERLKEDDLDIRPETALLLEPEDRFSPGLTYFVEAREGLRSKEGPVPLEKSVVFSFETFREFRFEGLANSTGLKPSEQLQFKFSNEVMYKSLVDHLRFDPPLQIPEYYSDWDYSSDVLYLSLPLAPETRYTAGIGPELTDDFGNSLGRESRFEFSTASYPPSVSMTTGPAVLEAFGEARYPLSVLNAESAFCQEARLKKDEIIPLLVQPKVFWSDQKLAPRPGFFQVEKGLPLKTPRNERRIVPLDISDVLAEKYGFVFIQVDTLRPEDKWERYLKAFIQVTDLGISGKFSAENNVIWITELRSGLPVPEANVEIRDDLNRIIWKGSTDREGIARPPGWKELGLKSRDPWDEPRQWIFATRGRDTALSSSEWGTGIDPYRFRISSDWNPQPHLVRGSIFTERGIYRAGEEVHIKGIVRAKEKGGWVLPPGKEVECEILDPLQKTVFKGPAILDEFGSFAFDFSSAPESSLGHYQIQAAFRPQRLDEKSHILSGSFRIEAFRPAEFEVHLRAEKENFVFGRDYTAEVRSSYLFGGAMAGQPVSWRLRLNRSRYSPPGHQGYVFGNELDWGDEEAFEDSRLAASGEAMLDAEGKFRIRHPLRPEREKDSVSATLEATVVNPSRRSISSRIQTLVHRGEYSIGLRPATSFLRKGEAQGVDVIAAHPDGSLQAGRKIRLTFFRREWRSVRQAGIGGRYRWLTEKDDAEVAAEEVRTGNEAVKVMFTPEKTGFYYLLASGLDELKNRITTTTYFYVTGPDYVPWERRDDDSIELVADAEHYQPGQKARILVKSPYEKAKALITVEREFILDSRVLDIESTSSQIEVPIGSEHIPNVFISVLLVQGRKSGAAAEESQDLGKPSFKIGYVNLRVDPAEKRLAMEILKEKEEYKPGDNVSLKFKVRDSAGAGCPASLAVAVVDVGVLNLIGYQTPDPFSEFYGERPLSVRTSETRIHVVGRRDYGEKGEDVSGGGGEGQAAILKGTLAEVALRGDFRTTAYWNPSLSSDEFGEVEVTFRLPDNLTTFRVMAVAQTKDSRFGGEETTFRVSKKLLLQAALPRFARVGDAFDGGVLVHNYSHFEGDVLLSASASGIRMTDSLAERRFKLRPGESREILYSFRAEQPGRASFRFRAAMAKESDGLELEIPLHLPRPTEAVALFGETRESAAETISVPGDVFPEHSRIEVQAASSALLSLKGSVDGLRDFPYLCLEQRLSALLPFVLAPQVLSDFGLTQLKPEEMRQTVIRGLEELSAYQMDSGGFGLWPESRREVPFLTGYALLTLIKAADDGYVVEKDRLERGLFYLDRFLREKWNPERWPFTRGDWETSKAFSLYVLALANQPQPAFAETLFTERENLPLFGKTLLLKALFYGKGSPEAQNTLKQELLNTIKVTPESAHFEEDEGRESRWTYASNTRTTASILQTLIEIGSDHPSLSSIAGWLVAQLRSGRELSTQEHLFVFYALNDYYRKVEGPGGELYGKISLAGKIMIEGEFKRDRRELKRTEMPISGLGIETRGGLALQAEKKGDGILYYGARMTYAPRGVLPARDEGIAVLKRLESLDGNPLEFISPGALVVVTVEVAVPQESLFIVVDDPLPAGLEAVNPVFLTESVESQRILEAAELSSIWPWWRGFNHFEMHDDRVLLFADSLPPGVHSHRYLARALSPGLFIMSGTVAKEMYAPEVFGRSLEKTVRVARLP
ncbi:MAG: MG2 domain-containing protein [Candidatus Aminicenantales bacterium]